MKTDSWSPTGTLLEADLMRSAGDLRRSSWELKALVEFLPDDLFQRLAEAAARCAEVLGQDRGGIFFVGNGGSAAQAEHLAAELLGRFERQRHPLRATALALNSPLLTALVNDYPAEEVFARPIQALMAPGDVLVALSTSGRSPNILRALETAGDIGCLRLGLTGPFSAELASRCNWVLSVPSPSVARIQEVHLLLGHLLCQAIETALYPAAPRTGEVGR